VGAVEAWEQVDLAGVSGRGAGAGSGAPGGGVERRWRRGLLLTGSGACCYSRRRRNSLRRYEASCTRDGWREGARGRGSGEESGGTDDDENEPLPRGNERYPFRMVAA
jgi:hypothetical protein